MLPKVAVIMVKNADYEIVICPLKESGKNEVIKVEKATLKKNSLFIFGRHGL